MSVSRLLVCLFVCLFATGAVTSLPMDPDLCEPKEKVKWDNSRVLLFPSLLPGSYVPHPPFPVTQYLGFEGRVTRRVEGKRTRTKVGDIYILGIVTNPKG